jgi:3'-phosphoadenosine 5'-phosphosulfate sulfotransferase (PAPS reductase)/FAD synthetase
LNHDSLTHIVLFSGGLASFEVGRRVLYRYGEEDVRFWFFDTLVEDEGLYRFLDNCETLLATRIERLADGRNPWQVFRDERFIGNSRVPLCNRVLKREFLERLLRSHYPDKDVVLHFGFEWFEKSRISAAELKWTAKGYQVEFSLQQPPLLSSEDLKTLVQQAGIELPRLYRLGFRHNNCGGACVQAGIKQWALLWHTFPQRYLWHEQQERITRDYLNKDVAILRDRTGGQTRPLTLRELRSRLETRHHVADDLCRPIQSFLYATVPMRTVEVSDG